MADYRSMYDLNYIYSFDLKGRDVTVTIGEVKAATIKGSDQKEQKKPIVYFRESRDKRGLVLCKTNAKTVAAMYGNDTDKWVGRRITLYPTQVSAFGAQVEAIRIRPTVPPAKAQTGELAETERAPQPEAPELIGTEHEPGAED